MAVFGMRQLVAVVLVSALALVAGCARRDFPRGQFQGYVIGKTQAEITDKIGAPTSIDTTTADKPVLIYENKTFDNENYNKPDPRTRIFMEKKDGKTVGVEVVFG